MLNIILKVNNDNIPRQVYHKKYNIVCLKSKQNICLLFIMRILSLKFFQTEMLKIFYLLPYESIKTQIPVNGKNTEPIKVLIIKSKECRRLFIFLTEVKIFCPATV